MKGSKINKLKSFIEDISFMKSGRLSFASADIGFGEGQHIGKVWWYEAFAVFCVCFSCISCGNVLGYTSTAIPSIKADNETFTGEIADHHVSLIGGLGPLGALFGSLCSLVVLKFLGSRRTTFLLGTPSLLASWLIIGFSTEVYHIFIGRFIGGVGVGAIISSAPLYIMDLSNISRRGKLGIMPQFLMLFGIFMAFILGSFLNWMDLAFASTAFTIIGGGLLLLAPDSPRWLVSKGENAKSLEILVKLNGRKIAEEILEDIEYNLKLNSSPNDQSKTEDNGQEIKKKQNNNKGVLKPLLVSLGIVSIQQLSGINGVTFFALTIFNQSKNAALGSHIPSIILATTQLIASFVSTMFVERYGRIILLKISSLIIGISGMVLGLYFNFYLDNSFLESLFWVPLLALVIFAFGFAIGLGPITWILVAEILPQESRHYLNPIVIAYNWFCVFTVTSSFPWLKNNIDFAGIFWLYAIIAFIGLIFFGFCVPETKGKTTEEIQRYFNKVKITKEEIQENPALVIQVISVSTNN